MSAAPGATVLVTGGSGYLASWIIVTLLQRDFAVRTTVRSREREAEVRAMVAGQQVQQDRLAVFDADLLHDEGWRQAFDGCDYAMHVAFPMPDGVDRDQDLVVPALAGTERVLKAAARAGVRRLVLTSSAGAALPPVAPVMTLDETLWTERSARPAYEYVRAKACAERCAWAFARRAKAFELTTILPGSIVGPVLGPNYTGAVRMIARLLQGKPPALPRIGFSMVDVRDLAELHLHALLSPAAAGQRFLGAGDFLWLNEVAAILRQDFGALASKVPTRLMPDLIVRTGALISANLARIAPQLGVRWAVNASKAQQMLGWVNRPAARSISDAAQSLIDQRLV